MASAALQLTVLDLQAKEEIAKLKAEAADERGRKKFVAEVLLAVGDGHQQYGALRGFRA